MNFADYFPLALRTAKPLPTPALDLRHAALGFITEIGEFVSEVKRIEIYGKPMSEEMRLHMIEELGDFNWYIPVMLKSAAAGNVLPALDASQVEELDTLNTIVDLSLMLWGTASVAVFPSISGAAFHDIYFPPAHELSEIAALQVAIIDRIALLLGTDGDQVRAQNIFKLQQRFPDAYSDAAAEARADKGGADHRTS